MSQVLATLGEIPECSDTLAAGKGVETGATFPLQGIHIWPCSVQFEQRAATLIFWSCGGWLLCRLRAGASTRQPPDPFDTTVRVLLQYGAVVPGVGDSITHYNLARLFTVTHARAHTAKERERERERDQFVTFNSLANLMRPVSFRKCADLYVVYLNICSLLSRTTYRANDALPLIWFEDILSYFEVNDAILPIPGSIVVWRASCRVCADTFCRLTQWRPSPESHRDKVCIH